MSLHAEQLLRRKYHASRKLDALRATYQLAYVHLWVNKGLWEKDPVVMVCSAIRRTDTIKTRKNATPCVVLQCPRGRGVGGS